MSFPRLSRCGRCRVRWSPWPICPACRETDDEEMETAEASRFNWRHAVLYGMMIQLGVVLGVIVFLLFMVKS